MELEKFYYDNRIPKYFAIATMFWAVVGMLAGVLAAFQLAFPVLNFDLAATTFGRLRPVHTNAVIFAFVGNGIFTAVYYSIPRLLKTKMYSDLLGKINFWGWQLIIVVGAITLMAGYTSGKEYAELEWPLDIAITIVWVIFGINMIGTILTRRERHLYVAIWFFLATWVTVALLHIVNSFEVPVTLFKSYSMYAGVQDALVQWWYGHNAVAFVLTTPYLGLMYYFVPKAANRPVYSYRLSIVHFWSLIFIYMWAGPHHLLYTALPQWAQSLGTAFSIMLVLPSWGGMLNGLFTLRGAWDRVREDPILKFFVVGITCYGMATFEGPMLSLKNVNAISHYSDWTVAHVHIGALGWNGFLTFGMLYWLIPRLFKTELYSKKLASTHFWIGTLGIILYAIPMYWAAFRAYFMLKAFTPEGQLQYQFIDVVQTTVPFYAMRAVGGTVFLTGVLFMVYNLYKTAKQGTFVEREEAEAAPLAKKYVSTGKSFWHSVIERKPILLTVLSLFVVGLGGVFEIIPTFLVKSNIPTIASVKPYTPLELQGRDIYVREGCYNCHSQMIRPFRYEVMRYGEYSKAGEFIYDHPFQWGSKRTGPDLARIGGKYPDSWHFNHMLEPTSMAPGSIMPKYPWLFVRDLDISTTNSKIHAMRNLGVPYERGYEAKANDDLKEQSEKIANSLKADKIKISSKKEIIALIAYLQRVGKDIKGEKTSN
ncbi:MAG TPA: cytochrome-c oxidase, cbb3-type subunit I [Chitinophagaceae bacterium]|nr:cytochrome-c oxidase, cbb3-type subunit I [Chitinophagaceae bacterium]HNF52149.1 cytochrome-c oxidase, cbb3-type subunit I [Chitinophagales bacterium]HNK12794.1 cytochrome-c oxidase, cbb3-type subunit I [Chitinophagales bacterium]HRG36046.1 cytochrome-c oxidase, cbb3-type subunit I [Chitinophagales bacterium]